MAIVPVFVCIPLTFLRCGGSVTPVCLIFTMTPLGFTSELASIAQLGLLAVARRKDNLGRIFTCPGGNAQGSIARTLMPVVS